MIALVISVVVLWMLFWMFYTPITRYLSYRFMKPGDIYRITREDYPFAVINSKCANKIIYTVHYSDGSTLMCEATKDEFFEHYSIFKSKSNRMSKVRMIFKKAPFYLVMDDNNVCVECSALVNIKEDIKEFVGRMKERFKDNKVLSERSETSLINEWCSHNLLYELGVKQARTFSVDFERKVPFLKRIAYFILGNIYC